MTIPVCQVLVTLFDTDGQTPLVGAYISATPSGPIVYQGVVIPVTESSVTDSAGQCLLRLVPSAIGVTPVTYTFTVWPAGAPRPTIFAGVTVPNVSSITFEELLGGTAGSGATIDTLIYMTGSDLFTGSLYFGEFVAPSALLYMTGTDYFTGSLYFG